MDPPLCANGCGFFGSHENHNMCSKCYKDHILKFTQKICESMRNITISSSSSDDQDLNTVDEHKNDEFQEKKRCKICNKKVGVTGGFMCRCGDLFCGKHRYPEEHSCNVDYKQIGRHSFKDKTHFVKQRNCRKFR